VVAATQCGQVARGRREAARRGVDIQIEAVAAVRLPVGAANWGLPTAQRRRLHRGGRGVPGELPAIAIGHAGRQGTAHAVAQIDPKAGRRGRVNRRDAGQRPVVGGAHQARLIERCPRVATCTRVHIQIKACGVIRLPVGVACRRLSRAELAGDETFGGGVPGEPPAPPIGVSGREGAPVGKAQIDAEAGGGGKVDGLRAGGQVVVGRPFQRGEVERRISKATMPRVHVQIDAGAGVRLPVGVARGRLPGADRLLRLILAVDIGRDLIAHDLLEPLAAFVIAVVLIHAWTGDALQVVFGIPSQGLAGAVNEVAVGIVGVLRRTAQDKAQRTAPKKPGLAGYHILPIKRSRASPTIIDGRGRGEWRLIVYLQTLDDQVAVGGSGKGIVGEDQVYMVLSIEGDVGGIGLPRACHGPTGDVDAVDP